MLHEEEPPMNLEPFSNLIRERCGILFNGEKRNLLRDIVNNRMLQAGFTSDKDYFNCLVKNDDEFSRLTSAITINETYFFREPGYFKILFENVIPSLLNKTKKGEKIKILSAGCSTGEEPYSIAIALAYHYGLSFDKTFSIIGFDIDSEALDKARQANYGLMSFREKMFGIPDKFFRASKNGRFQLDDSIRSRVEFKQMNLLESDMSSIIGSGYDIIFYRNVSIYFGVDTMSAIFRNLSNILNDDGFIITSATETYSHNLGILSLIEIGGAFLYQKKISLDICDRRKSDSQLPDIPSAIKKMDDFLIKRKPSPPIIPPSDRVKEKIKEAEIKETASSSSFFEKRNPKRQNFDEAIALAEEKRYDEALNKIENILSDEPDFCKALSLKVSILINLNNFDEAEKICKRIIEIEEWSLEGHLLLGLIYKIRGTIEKALTQFNKALYIEPSSWLVHFYLAECYMSLGEIDKPVNEFEIAVKILEKGNIRKHGMTLFPLLFPAEQLIYLCRTNIKKLMNRKNIE